jgi:hypothetical protein
MIPALAAAFVNPPAVYRPMMFWVWNGEVTHDRIDHDLAEMKAKGCGGFFIHPMGESFRLHDFLQGQSPPYLSDEYFALVRYAVERAEAEGLYAWLYDEGGWPSGTAQGHVVEGHPEFRGKVLTAHVGPETPEGDVVATLLLRQREAPQVLPEGSPAPEGVVVHFVMRPGGFPVDMLDPAAVRRFIDVTHERYREYVGDHFGTTVPGMFTDEPRVGGRVGSKEVMWTPAMLAAFEQDHGYDLRPYLPLLFSPDALGLDASTYYPEGAMEAVRCAFFDTWTRLHREAYWDQLNAWCEAHKLLHVGHVGGEDTLASHIGGGFGEYFRTAGTLDVPGVDAIWRQLWPDQPKLHYPLLAASAAHQKGPAEAVGAWPRSGLALTESFGVYGFGLDFAGMKWVTDYQFVRGINQMCPMAYSMYTEGGRLYRTLDYIGPGNPLWEHYAGYADYVGRLSLVGRAGESAAGIAVYYPIEALWAGGAGDTPGSFETICGLLEDRQVEFDIIGGDAVLHAGIEDGMLVTPGAAYELLILPEMSALRRSVAEKLSQFRAGGGRIAFLGDGPASVTDGPALRPTAEAVPGLLEGAFSVDIPKELDTLVAAFGGQSARSMVLEFDGFSAAFKGTPWLQRFAARRLAPGVALTVPRDNLGPFAEIMGATATRAHLGLDTRVEGLRLMSRLLGQASIHLLVNERDEDRNARLLLTSDQALRLEAWDPETGERFVLAEHTDISEVTPVELSLRPHRSLVLVVAPPDALPPPTREAPSEWPVREALGSLGPPEAVSGWEIRDGDVAPLRSLPSVAAGTPPTEEGRWDLIPGCEHFSGTMAYRLRFTGDEGWATRPSALELDQVRYVAEAWLNEHPLGARLWPPYRWDTTGLIRPGQNELLVHVTNTLANAALKPEVMQQAKDRGWWNVYRERAQPMMEESLPSGVDPVVMILLGDGADD